MKATEKLIDISSSPLSIEPPDKAAFETIDKCLKKKSTSLFEVLSKKNGFLAFESALQVFPSKKSQGVPGIFDWNSPDGWRRHYDEIQTPIIFFAQDLFACQFGISSSGIVRFEPESGEVNNHSGSLEEWAQKILIDYDFETGWSIGREWQERNGILSNEYRLLGKVPFVMGGEYEYNNMRAVELNEAMDKLGKLYQQIKDVQDGNVIKIKGWIS